MKRDMEVRRSSQPARLCLPGLLLIGLLLATTSVAGEPQSEQALQTALERQHNLAEGLLERGYFDHAIKARKEVIRLTALLHGADHWRVNDAQSELASVQRLAKLNRRQRRELDEASGRLHRTPDLLASGRFEEAKKEGEQGLATLERLIGQEDVNYSAACYTLARLYAAADRPHQANQLVLQAVGSLNRALGENNPRVADCLMMRAALVGDAGDLPQAKKLCRQALEIRRRSLGQRHEETLDAWRLLGLMFAEQFQFAEAHEHLTGVLRTMTALHGRGDEETAQVLLDLAYLNQTRGDYREADRLFRQSVEMHRSVSGEASREYALALHKQAQFYLLIGQREKYVETAADALDAFRQATTDGQATAADALRIAQAWQDTGDEEQSLRLVQLVYKRLAARDLPSSDWMNAARQLGERYHEAHRHLEAEPLLKEACDQAEHLFGPNHPRTIHCLTSLAALYRDMADWHRSGPLSQSVLDRTQTTFGAESVYCAIAWNRLGLHHQHCGEYAEALRCLEQASEIYRRRLGADHPLYAESLGEVAGVLYEGGDSITAERQLRRALQITTAAIGGRHPNCAAFRKQLAQVLQSLDRPEEALAEATQALEILEHVYGRSSPQVASGLEACSTIHRQSGRHQDAEDFSARAKYIRARQVEQTAAKEKTEL